MQRLILLLTLVQLLNGAPLTVFVVENEGGAIASIDRISIQNIDFELLLSCEDALQAHWHKGAVLKYWALRPHQEDTRHFGVSLAAWRFRRDAGFEDHAGGWLENVQERGLSGESCDVARAASGDMVGRVAGSASWRKSW